MPLRVYRQRWSRAAAALLAAVLVALTVLSLAAVAAEADHDCSGTDCEVCALVRTAVARFALGGEAVVAAACLVSLLCGCAALSYGVAREALSFSLITCKVRLNN